MMSLNIRYVGDRHDAAFIGLSAIASPQVPVARAVDITVNPAYTLVWLGGEWRVHRDLSFFARIDNLTDAAYESVLGYPGLPRTVVGGVRFNIGAR
jgi:outer membrane cobalamin receptor